MNFALLELFYITDIEVLMNFDGFWEKSSSQSGDLVKHLGTITQKS